MDKTLRVVRVRLMKIAWSEVRLMKIAWSEVRLMKIAWTGYKEA